MKIFSRIKNKCVLIIFFMILNILVCHNISYATENSDNEKVEDQYIYLSDISWTSGSSAGWGNITKDKTTEGKTLSQKVNGATVVFDKGIFAHAKSTIIYDLTNYDYDYFTTYYGVSSHQGGAGSVKFYIYTSDNGTKWDLQTSANPTVMTGSTNAEFVKISIKGKKYLKLYADPNGSNGNDHAQYLNSKLIKEGYSDNVEVSVEELDELIKTKYNNNENDEELEKYILQRELINNIGQYQLSKFYQGDQGEQHKETFHWIFNDLDRLRLFVTGGEPNGTWLRTLQVLNDLYQTNKSDLEATGTTPNGVPLKDIYLKMMLTLSLTHSKDITFWIASSGSLSPNPNASDALTRYEIYKNMLVKGKLKIEVFEQLEIEEMRYIMQSFIGDDEIEWMRDYTTASGKNWYNASNFMQYKGVSIAEYRNDKYYGTNRKNYESKYKLTNYSVKNNKYYPKNWIIMEAGGVCWQISNLGVNVVVSHGVPAMSLGQYPSAGAHECYVVYTLNGYKDGCWTIYNSAAGWDETNSSAYAANTGYNPYTQRYVNGWGNGSYGGKFNGAYLLLGQGAINDYDNYVKANEKVLLANTYASNTAMREKIYREALSIQPINLDAWLELINIYNKDSSRTEQDYYNLLIQLTDSLKYYPKPMMDLVEKLESHITDPNILIQVNLLKTTALNTAAKAQDVNVANSEICRAMANIYLGNADTKFATFSFDGDEANTINFVASSYYELNSLWDYSLDGGKTWKTVVEGSSKTLVNEEVKQITPENDILVHIVGTPYTTETIYTIDITAGRTLSDHLLYACNLDKGIYGIVYSMEWRYYGEETWNPYRTSVPDCTGEKVIQVRYGASGTRVAGNIQTFTFTEADQTPEKKYIPWYGNYSLVDFSSETKTSPAMKASYAISDRTPTGNWQTVSGDNKRYIVIGLKDPVFVSQLQYVNRPDYAKGITKNAKVYASMDNKNWTEVGSITNAPSGNDPVNIEFYKPTYAKYIKFQATATNDGLLSIGVISLFQDVTKVMPGIDVEYSTIELTKDNVTAYITCGEGITINNEDIPYNEETGKYEYVFTESKTVTLKYTDIDLQEKEATLVVDWIDTEIPVGKLTYDTTTATNGTVTVQIGCTKEAIHVTNNDGKNTYTFTENGSFTFEFEDLAGNKNTATAVVDYIDKAAPIPTVTFDTKEPIKGNVAATIKFNEPTNILSDISLISQEDGSYTYIFEENEEVTIEFEDYVGNKSETTIKVDWIIPGLAKTWIEYNIDDTTDQNVIVKVCSNEEITILNNNGSKEYTFIENGRFDFEYCDTRDNYGTVTAEVSWIEKQLPNVSISYNIIEKTNQDVVVTFSCDEPVTLQTNQGEETYTFTENGQFDFIYVAENGQMGITTAKVDWIDKVTPVAMVNYNITEATDEAVVATINCDEEIVVTNNNGEKTYTFDKNGSFTFEYKDLAGNTNTTTATVNWINPRISLEYSEEELTNQDVTVTISCDREFTVTNNDGNKTHTFTENGEFEFKYITNDGFEGIAIAKVDWIDREIPVARVSYDVTETTYGIVTATLICDKEEIIITNNDGQSTYVFTENGTFEFEYKDLAGNTNTTTAKVDWINSEVTVEYSTTKLTNQDVVVTIVSDKPITVTNNNGEKTHTFTENDTFVFEYTVDNSNFKGYVIATVNWIDKEIPIVKVVYDETETTTKNVTATLVCENKDITITNNSGKNTYIFKFNGEFTFNYKDNAGNTGSATAKVDWINREDIYIEYNITEPTAKAVTATVVSKEEIEITNNYGVNSYSFRKNGSFTFEYKKNDGTKGTITAIVDWIVENSSIATWYRFDPSSSTAGEVIMTVYDRTGNNDERYITNVGSGSNWVVPSQKTDTYVFTENGSYYVYVQNKYGAQTSLYVTIDWIDNASKNIEIEYSTTDTTNQDVIATLANKDTSNPITVTNCDEGNTHTFAENGEFTFEYQTNTGLTGKKTAKVDWIDKESPVATVKYNITEPTIKNVVATLECDEEITITSDGGKTHTFTENGSFTFEYKDAAGNTNTSIAEVSWIESELPEVTIKYDITEPTQENVVATLECNEEIVIKNNDGKNTYEFTENGSYTFVYTTELGLVGEATAEVNWIDRILPVGKITYNITEETTSEVVATLECDEEIIITSDGGKTHTFTENGSFTFEYKDLAGNTNKTEAVVDWIKVKEPTFDFTISTNNNEVIRGSEFTLKAKIGNLQNTEKGLVVLSGKIEFDTTKLEIKTDGIKGLNSWNFSEEDFNLDNFKFITDNDEIGVEEMEIFEITFVVKEDAELGNTEIKFTSIEGANGELNGGIAKANDISTNINILEKQENEEPKIESQVYTISQEENIITRINRETSVLKFKDNIQKNCEIIITDKDGKVLSEDDLVSTGDLLKLDNSEQVYQLVVSGDTDGDGRITVNDLAQTKLHLIGKNVLEGIYAKAGNMDLIDEKITVNDLAILKLTLIEKITP